VGLVSDRFIEDLNLFEKLLESHAGQMPSHYLHFSRHIYEAAAMMTRHGLSLIPLVDDDHQYVGSVTQTDLAVFLTRYMSLGEPGGVIVLQNTANSYSISQISQIVESNDARILHLVVSKPVDDENTEITIKLDKVELSSVIQTFSRYGYQISSVYMDDSMLHDMYEDRIELLIRYMNL
jgi:CBS domain-containing protein